MTVEEGIEMLSFHLDTRLSHAGFSRHGGIEDWRRERSSDLHDRLLVLYGRKYSPALVSCSPMVSVYSPALVNQVRKWFGEKFSTNNFGAKNVGFYTPSRRFLSWDCTTKSNPEVIAKEIGDCFIEYCLPELERVRTLNHLLECIDQECVSSDAHNWIISNIAPTCLLFLAGRSEECRERLIKMSSLYDELNERDKWGAQFLPKRDRVEKFINSLA